ncbi:ligand-binding sensor domain-containing protein [Tenacibaculum caenipelagi]|uniref:Two component regulator with propeller domain n=1 Tax=Tenacibaculum caenipelagi TaxID=1325435 RepID=A0A4R6TC30_9FLAO|nr:two-component regulator propeller domain-containing protein [Tenacibaculum caenipelagi]TDQ24029.1 two component regulator with propeller domain [Tenacibaculum caenipelagi]
MWLRIIALLFCWCGVAQNKPIHYSASNGLPHDITYGLFQDSSGYIWIGTDNGLVKYDGNEFKIFTIKEGLRSNYVIDVNETKDNKIVVGTWGGGVQLIQNDSVLISTGSTNHFSKISKIDIQEDAIIASSGKNSFHVLYKNGNSYLEEKTNFKINKDALLFNIRKKIGAVGSRVLKPININGELFYIGGNNFGLQKIKGIISLNFKQFSYKEEFPFLGEKEINDLIYEEDEGAYIGLSDTEEIIFDNKKILEVKPLKFKTVKNNYKLKRFVKTKRFNAYVLEDDFHISDQIVLYDNVSKKEINFSSEQEINTLVSDIIKDKDENIWISLNGQGVYFIPNTYEHDNKSFFNDVPLHDVLQLNNNNLYFLSLTSIYSLNTYEQSNTYPFTYFLGGFNASLSNKDSLTITTTTSGNYKRKLIEFDKELKKVMLLKLCYKKRIKNSELSMSYWGDELNIITNENKSQLKINFKEETQIKDVQLINDELWVATNFGFFIYDSKSFKEKRRVASLQGLSNTNIKSFTPSQKKIYVATINGLNVIEKDSVKVYTKKDGLPSDNLNHVFVDHHNIVWLSHQKGYSVFKNGNFYNFTKENGSSFSYVNKIIEDKDDFIWLVGSNGAKRITNTLPFKPSNKPSIQVNNRESQFKLNVIDFSGEALLVQYKVGDNYWISTQERTYDFSNYQYGKHKVQFRVRRSSSDWSYSKVYSFSNVAPWYKTWWGVLIISVGILLLLVYRILSVLKKNRLLKNAMISQKRLEKELSEVRQNVASDFHDELGNKLAGITIVSELILKDEFIKQSNSFEAIKQIQRDAKSLYFGIRDFVWSIDSKSDYLEELVVYLSDFGEELFQNSNITFKVEKEINKEIKKLPSYWSRQLLLLFKEAMTNSYKHSNASEVVLSIILKKNILKIELKDNGKGFVESELKRKNGLDNMKKRAHKIEGSLQITTKEETKVIFTGMINK